MNGINAAGQHRLDDRYLAGRNMLYELRHYRASLPGERIPQVAECHAPWMTDGRIPARHRHIPQVSMSLKSGEIGNQEFASPDLAIRPEAGTIEGHADHFPGQMIFSHATGDVRMMMLHADLTFQVEAKSETGTHVVGMEVVRHRRGCRVIDLLQILESLLKEKQCFVVLKVTDVLAEN